MRYRVAVAEPVDASAVAALCADVIRHGAERREAALRDLARGHLPRVLRWLPRYPRALAAVYLIRPSWRPVIWIGIDPAAGDTAATLVWSAASSDGRVFVF